MTAESRIVELERWQRHVQRDLDRLPLYLPPPPEVALVKIIGGNLLNSVEQIAYIADGSLSSITALYDPDVDTSYIDGIGNGWLYDRYGRQLRRVLIRHNCAAYTDPLPVDRTFLMVGGTTLTVASGGDMGKTMSCYTPLRG